jgi:hypothetical protein
VLEALLAILKAFSEELAKRLAGSLAERPAKALQRSLLKMYVAADDLFGDYTAVVHLLMQHRDQLASSQDDEQVRLNLRQAMRELLGSLKRFERHLQECFGALRLLSGDDLTIGLAEVAVSSYNLFRTHFGTDIAPRFVAAPDTHEYMLRVTRRRQRVEIVDQTKIGTISLDLKKQFETGELSYSLVNINDGESVDRLIKDAKRDLADFKSVVDKLADLVRAHVDLSALP